MRERPQFFKDLDRELGREPEPEPEKVSRQAEEDVRVVITQQYLCANLTSMASSPMMLWPERRSRNETT